MENLKAFDCANAFVGCYFTDDKACMHCNREHTLIYIYSGELEITMRGRKTILHKGDCAFMRRDNSMMLQKHATKDVPYRSIVIKFSREFLREFYHTLNKREIPASARRNKKSLYVLPVNRPDIRSLFDSLIPYFDADTIPSEEIVRLKMTEGVYAILNTDFNLYASLFDFIDPWKIDIIAFMEKNYMNEMTMADMAYFTGRSLSTFKRDFRQCSDLTPQKWLIRRRLMAARELLRKGGAKISDVCYDVGFKNLSHFSKAYKNIFGIAPTADIR